MVVLPFVARQWTCLLGCPYTNTMYCCLLFTVVERSVAPADVLRVRKHVCVMSLAMDDVAGL